MGLDPSMPAFPRDERYHGHNGLTIRQHFASQAMAALCANPGGPFQANDQSGWSLCNCTPDAVARTAVEMADALIAQLAATQEPST